MKNKIELLLKKLENDDDFRLTSSENEEVVRTLPLKTIRKYKDRIMVSDVFKYKRLNEKEIEEFMGWTNGWHDLTVLATMQKLSEKFMKEHRENLPWTIVSVHQKMSNKFIKENSRYIDFSLLPFYQEESVDKEMLKNKKVQWKLLSRNFPLSEDFVINYFEFLDKDSIKANKKIKITPKIKLLLELN
jgi:hypothetical protein